MNRLDELLAANIQHEPRLDIWRRYPYIAALEDQLTDNFACETVSAGFAGFALEHCWNAEIITAEEAEQPLAGHHAWVRLSQPGSTSWLNVDWTARQFHNLYEPARHDEKILSLPWPFVWESTGPQHPVVGRFARISCTKSP